MPGRVGDPGKGVETEIVKIATKFHPDQPPRVVVTDSAAIPRERSLFVAWWVAIVATALLVAGLVILIPKPYLGILLFVTDGAKTTIEITVISIGAALVVGLFAGLGRTSRNPIINGVASLYVEIIRGIPLLVQLFWIYYALAQIVALGDYPSAIVGLAVCYGAYIGEIFRAGIQSIPKGQWEAARSLGMSGGQAMTHVILPQAIRVVLPPIGNEFIALLKDSSLVSVLAISDLLRRGREYASRTFAYFQTYTLVAMIYLLMTLVFSRVVFYIERGMSTETKAEGRPAFMHRLAAYVADAVVVYVLWLALNAIASAAIPKEVQAVPFADIPTGAWISLGIALAVFVLYLLVPWALGGQTPGKMAVGIKIIGPDEQPPGLVRALVRLVPYLVTILPLVAWITFWGGPLGQQTIALADIPWWSYLLLLPPIVGVGGFLWCQWDRYGQGWHDRLAGTYVVRS